MGANATEKHYTLAEIAALWNMDRGSVRRIFEEEPDVLRIESRKLLSRKRPYTLLRVPESTLCRVYQNRTNGALAEIKRSSGGVKKSLLGR